MADNQTTSDQGTTAPTPTTTSSVPQQPQPLYFDDQDILDLDLDEMYNNTIVPLDLIRSYLGDRPQESRINAFYRMTGLPVVAPVEGNGIQFYSPGYDPELNLDMTVQQQYANIAALVTSDTTFVATQLDVRENNTQKYYKPIWAAGTLNATALGIASTFIRSFSKQLTDGIVFPALDKGQEQTINERINYLQVFYSDILQQINNGDLTTLVKSKHYLRPFVVDPRIASAVQPRANSICAPFLGDKSQTKLFDSPNGTPTYLRRPYIERVISSRISNSLNSNNINNNQAAGQAFMDQLATTIQNNKTLTNQDLINFSTDQQGYFNSEINIFNRYFRLMRAVLNKLYYAANNLMYVIHNINWQPVPDSTKGPEGGGTMNAVNPGDGGRNVGIPGSPPFNPHWELDIINATAQKYVNQALYDIGVAVTVDPGDFAFSNLDDTVFSVSKVATASYDDQIDTINNKRNHVGNGGIDNMKTIEIIMGEFGGIGMLDILVIQTALWIMPINSLVGLIDQRAFTRMQFRMGLNPTLVTQIAQNPISEAMGDFDTNVSLLLKLVQKYYDGLSTGDTSLKNST